MGTGSSHCLCSVHLCIVCSALCAVQCAVHRVQCAVHCVQRWGWRVGPDMAGLGTLRQPRHSILLWLRRTAAPAPRRLFLRKGASSGPPLHAVVTSHNCRLYLPNCRSCYGAVAAMVIACHSFRWNSRNMAHLFQNGCREARNHCLHQDRHDPTLERVQEQVQDRVQAGYRCL